MRANGTRCLSVGRRAWGFAMNRSYGWQRQHPDQTPTEWRRAFGKAHLSAVKPIQAALGAFDSGDTSKVSLRRFRGPYRSQGNASSCVAFSCSRAIQMLEAIWRPSEEPVFPSAQAIYYGARAEAFAGEALSDVRIEDTGCAIANAVASVRALGYVREDVCPYDVSRINEEPNPQVLVKAYDARDLVTYSIPASVKDDVAIDACLRDLSDALSSFCPVVFGMFVDAGFELALPGSLISSIDDRAIVGGHAMTVLEYAPQAGYVVVDNWWDGWGDGDGLGYIDARLWAKRACDVTAFVYAPPTS